MGDGSDWFEPLGVFFFCSLVTRRGLLGPMMRSLIRLEFSLGTCERINGMQLCIMCS